MGIKIPKNKPVLHAEVKKQHGIFLTDSVWLKLKNRNREQNTSTTRTYRALGAILALNKAQRENDWLKPLVSFSSPL